MRILFLLLISCFALMGCEGRVLLDNISQRQSLEVVNYLANSGIEGYPEKTSGSRDRYLVRVNGADYFDAVELLEKAQLPRPEKQSSDELLSSGGIFPQSREIEQLKLERIYASEIEQMLSKYEGVKEVEAVVRLSSKNNPFSAVNLHIKLNPQAQVRMSQVEDAILRIVPGVTKETVAISMDEVSSVERVTPAEKTESFLGFAKVASEDRRGLALAFTLCLLLFGAGGGIIGYYFGMLRSSAGVQKDHSNQYRGSTQIGENADDLLPKVGGIE